MHIFFLFFMNGKRKVIAIHTLTYKFHTMHGHTLTCINVLTEDVTYCPTLEHTHRHSLSLSLFPQRTPPSPWPSLFISQSVSAPLSMLIVHCSKAAFIMMIKHSQATAQHLKASGSNAWQVTSHTNRPAFFILPRQVSSTEYAALWSVTGCRFMSPDLLMSS